MPTLRVPQDFASIAAAVANAAPGDTILVGTTYIGNEAATISKNGLIVSAPASVQGIVLNLGSGVTGLRLAGDAHIEVFGNAGNNTITGNAGDNFFGGGGGNDRLDGGLGSDYVDYRNATGAVNVNLATGRATGAAGADTLISIENVRGSNFADTLTGNAGDNFLRGMGGNDKLIGGEGFDWADYRNATGSVTVNLATGKATGADGSDTLTGIEYARGSKFADVLTGNAGDNWFRGLEGNDRINGGAGFDYADYRNATGSVTVNLTTGKSSGAEGVDTLLNIEGVRGSEFADTLTGNAGDNWLRGLGGNDKLDGGGGFDVVSYRDASGSVTVNLATGKSSGAGGADTLINIEHIQGSFFADTLTGNAANNYLRGMGGNDRLAGGTGSDTADYLSATGSVTVNLVTGKSSGADGIDTLVSIENVRGSSFSDTIIGNGLANVLTGLGGADTLTGGGANDTFYYFESAQSPTGAGADRITDFDDVGNDTIDFSALSAGTLTYRHNGAFTAAGQVRINDIAGGDVLVEVNLGGTLAADMQIRLAATTLASMTATDFNL